MRFENQAYLLKQMEEKDSRKNEAPAAHLLTLTRLTSFAGIEQHGSLVDAPLQNQWLSPLENLLISGLEKIPSGNLT